MTTTRATVDEQMSVLMRGAEYGDPHIQATMEEELRARLAEGRPLRVYAGFDPTAVDLHLGHIVPMMKLRQFQDLGHEVTFLIGTMTAVIGDPTDRTSSRVMQTPEQVEELSRTWLGQAFRILDPDKTIVRRNGDWLSPMTLADFVRVASNFTVQQFLDHDTFRRRIDARRPIYLHEFIYALMQGYDALAMDTDVQVGGTEQLFNMFAGRTLQRAHGQKPHIAVCLPILIGTDGNQRMSKSTGNYIGLDEPPADMYGKIMSIPDTLIVNYFTLLVPNADVAAIEQGLAGRSLNPMDVKKQLSHSIVALLNDADAADAAQAEFERVFQRREDPDDSAQDLAVVLGPGGRAEVDITQLISQAGVVSSRSEARRLLSQGALAIDGDTLSEARVTLKEGSLVRVGRHRFLRVVPA
jgi:tyrosyl-tRNA synthetase